MENNNENTEQYTPLEDSVTANEAATINEPETTESANFSSYSPELPSEETVSEDASSSSSEEIDLGNYNKPMDLSYFDTPKIAEDDKKHEGSADESQDYSWLENVSDKDIDNLLNEKIEKSNVEPTNISREYDTAWGKLEETAKNSPMYAKAGISTELNNPETHEQTKKETMEKAEVKDPLEEPGLFSEEEKKDIRSRLEEPNMVQKVFGKASEFLIPFAGKTIKETIAPEPMKNQEAYIDALVRFKKNNPLGYAESKKALDEAYEGSKKGSFTHGLDYYALTGDTNGNAYAESIDKIIKELPEDTPKEVIDKILNPDPITREQINNLSMEAEKNEKVKALAIEEATIGTTSLALGLAAPYIKAGLGKIIEKIPEEVSNKITEKIARIALHGDKGEAFWNNLLEKKIEAGGQTFKLGDLVSIQNLKKSNVSVGNTFQGRGVTNPDTTLQIVTGVQKALEEAGLKIVEKGADVAGGVSSNLINRLIAESAVDAGLAKKTAIATGITAGAVTVGNALSTGIPDESGRQINSRDIVSDRQDNPYNGDDAVTLRTNEGTVTVSPREAVIIGEAEHLTPEMGYTEDVIKSAEGSEIIPTEKDNDYGFDFSDAEMKAGYYDKDGNYIGEYPERSFLTKVGDVVQAILGGKDINNDKTISAREWYDSTLGKLFKGTANVISSLSPKNIKSTIDKLGQKLSDSLPGVYDMKTGDVYINQDYKGSLPISPGEAKVKIRNVLDEMLPSYSDSTAQSAKKELIGNVIGLPIYNLPGQIASKFIGNYITSVADEISWLESGKRMEPGQKYATNLVITNGVMSAFDPLSSVANLLSEAKGLETGAKIESKFNGQLLLPYDEVYINFSSDQEDKPYTASSGYGTSDESLKANGKYSGYREQAKDSNLAKNYNEGLEKDVNEAVSDMKVKVFSVYNNEPDYIRNAIGKILKSFKENY
ncbi:MAG: hypothetical protein II411_06200 [Lachnospiraceae bacterium]|nr:hypothetical protein [Lachnospiraceae bacterium]